MSFPAHVVPGELIESAWGNDVVDTLEEINADLLAWAGSYTGPAVALGGSFGSYTAVDFTAPFDGTFAVWVVANFTVLSGSVQCVMKATVDATSTNPVGTAFVGTAGMQTSLTDFGLIDLTAGAHSVFANSMASVAGAAQIASITGLVHAVKRGT
jgi:hypothetical protein